MEVEFGGGALCLEEGAACGEEFLERSVKVDQMAEGHALLCSSAWLYRTGGWQVVGPHLENLGTRVNTGKPCDRLH